MEEHYAYGEGFQTKVIALAVQDPVFLSHYSDIFNPEYFEFSSHVAVARFIKDYFKEYHARPSKEGLDALVLEYCVKYNVDSVMREQILTLMQNVFSMDISDAAFVKEKIINFGRRQSFLHAIMQCIDLAKKEDGYERGSDIMFKAMRVGLDVEDLGIDFFPSCGSLRTLAARDGAYNPARKVPTLLPDLDHALLGGLGAGEVGSIMAPPGWGKSALMVNFSAGAVYNQVPVIYFTIGDMSDYDIAVRHAARFSGIPIDTIVTEDNYDEKALGVRIMKMIPHANPQMRIKYYNPKSVGVQTLRAYMTRMQSEFKFEPGLIIVDYADKLISSRGISAENSYQALGDIYDDLKILGHDFRCPVWTGSQVQRNAWSADLIDQEHAADSALKIANADVVLTINRTKEERLKNKIRLFGAKVRRGRDATMVNCVFQKEICYIKQDAVEEKLA